MTKNLISRKSGSDDVLEITGNFGDKGSMGSPSFKSLVKFVAKHYQLLTKTYKRQVNEEAIPYNSKKIAKALLGDER